MLHRKQCWSDGAAPVDQDNAVSNNSRSLTKPPYCYVRARSLNSLDCLNPSAPLIQRHPQQSTSSSSSSLARAELSLRYPLFPCRSPEPRCPTPSGLPSFGTTDAETLRLMPLTHIERLTRFLHARLVQRGTVETPNQQSQVVSNIEHQHVGPTNRESCDEPAEILRRVLGTTRPIAIPIAPVRPARSALPKGVIRSAHPGVLARADDRTYVRGRFGVRASAHGVGNRHLDFHPFARTDGSNEIDAAVREIDKACREIGNRQHETVSNEGLSIPRCRENTSPRSASTTAMAIAESLTAIQAIEREQRALRALRESKRENMRLKAALDALQDSMMTTRRESDHAGTDVNAHNNQPARTVRQLDSTSHSRLGTIIDIDTRLRGASEQTTDGRGPPIRASHPDMAEPALYSSYSSYSYSPDASDISPPRFTNPAQRNLPTMESMIEHQTEAERRQATDEALNQYQTSKITKCDHC